MATVHVCLAHVIARAAGGPAPVVQSVPVGSDTVTSSGTSAQSSLTASPSGVAGSQFWSVTATGGNVFVAFGSDPTAAADAGWLVLDGQTREFSTSQTGEKIAIKDA